MASIHTSLTRQITLDGQGDSQDRHQDLVGHGIYDGTDDGAQVPLPGYPAIKQIGNAGIGEQTQGPGMIVMDNTVADEWGGNQAGSGQ